MAKSIPEDHHQVYWLAGPRASLQELAENASNVGRQDALKQAVADFNERLKQAPLSVGELYRQKGEVAEHIAANEFFWVDFAVDIKRKVVAVRRCWATARGGL